MKRFTHQPKLQAFEVTQTAMDQARGTARDARTKIVLFNQSDPQPTVCCKSGNGATIDSPAYNNNVMMTARIQYSI